jgi:hypothetical protein
MIQARITKHFRLDSSIRIGTPRNRNHGSETTVWHANLLAAVNYTEVSCLNQQATQKVALSVLDQGKGKGRAVDLSPCADTRTTDKWYAQDSEERVRAALLQHMTIFISTLSLLHVDGHLHGI